MNQFFAACIVPKREMPNTRQNNQVNIQSPRPEEKLLPSRVSRKGLPCPEIHDTHLPVDDNDDRGFIKVESRQIRQSRRQAARFVDDEE